MPLGKYLGCVLAPVNRVQLADLKTDENKPNLLFFSILSKYSVVKIESAPWECRALVAVSPVCVRWL